MNHSHRPTDTLLNAAFGVSLALVLLSSAAFGQQPTQSDGFVLTPSRLDEVLKTALTRTGEYVALLTNLITQETKTIEVYDAVGHLSRHKRIVSDLVIYQSQLDGGSMAEYRNVREVDGVAVARRQQRIEKLFVQLSKATSVRQELDRIDREGSKYDEGYRFNGLTLTEGLPLQENLRAAFSFAAVGREFIGAHEAIVLQYQQIKQSPDISFKLVSLPSQFKTSEPLLRGRLWLDAQTAQLRREERELTLHSPDVAAPLILLRFEFDYAPSKFGSLLPQKLVYSIFNHFKRDKGKDPVLSIGSRTTFDYGTFEHFHVTVQARAPLN